ncbi:metallophosphoesterase family protein [Rhizobium sp. AAP116]|uniref:metallophosphoesterase family protein n=1 Tax=Rhizobium sp. AAP116 TaxID=1523429 RepID=UPI0006B94D09|nr:metallophosphoesterase family protein [Rhizobium sp. AAP116]KPF61123.1 hypothetical protein IP85_00550 [Rhizobium sp. AAP116]
MREPYSSEALPVLADIHGNRMGFEAVLDRLATLNIRRPPLLLGDLVWTHFCDRSASELVMLLDRIMSMPLTGAVCGNTDAFFLNGWLERWDPADAEDQRTRSHMLSFKSCLSAAHLAFLGAMPNTQTFVMSNRTCLACHASPRDNRIGLTLDMRTDDVDAHLDGRHMYCLVTGHLHTPFVRVMESGLLHISVGAVGRHPHEYDGIVDFAILDHTPSGLVAVHHRLLEPQQMH